LSVAHFESSTWPQHFFMKLSLTPGSVMRKHNSLELLLIYLLDFNLADGPLLGQGSTSRDSPADSSETINAL